MRRRRLLVYLAPAVTVFAHAAYVGFASPTFLTLIAGGAIFLAIGLPIALEDLGVITSKYRRREQALAYTRPKKRDHATPPSPRRILLSAAMATR